MRFACLCFLMILFSMPALSQKQGREFVDSLLSELPRVKDDSAKCRLYHRLAFKYDRINPDSGMVYARMQLELAEQMQWKGMVASAYNNLGNSYSSKSRFDKTLEYYTKAEKIYTELNDENGLANISGSIGNVYAALSNDQKALEYYLKALPIFQKLDNKEAVSSTYSNMGSMYNSLKQREKALESHFKSLEINKQLRDTGDMANNYANIGVVFFGMERYDTAFSYMRAALAIYEKQGNRYGEASILGNIAAIYLNLYFKSKKEGTTPLPLNYYDSVEQYGKKSIAIYHEMGDKAGEKSPLLHLYELYKEKGDYKNALECFTKATALKDSLFASENSERLSQLESQREIDLREKEIEIQKLQLQRGNLQKIALAAGLALVLASLFFIYRQRQKSERLLLNILPGKIAARLKGREKTIADYFDSASIVFIDIKGFTDYARQKHPNEIVHVLNDIFTQFDSLVDRYSLEKIKTIGDSYMAAAGVPEPDGNHAANAARFALDAEKALQLYTTPDGTKLQFRIGIASGPVVAGVIGRKKFIYDMWGDTVNTASRMESNGVVGRIQVSDGFRSLLGDTYNFEEREEIEVKGLGKMKTWFLLG